MDWNGLSLATNYALEAGYTSSDTTAFARILRYVNEAQTDICAKYKWPFLNIKLERVLTSGDEIVSIAPPKPSAPSASVVSGGSLEADTTYYIRVTFQIFDETGDNDRRIESVASSSASATTTTTDKTVILTGIGLWTGSSASTPNTVWRNIYVSTDNVNFYYHSTITDNTTTTIGVTSEPTSTEEPPFEGLVDGLSDSVITIESGGSALRQVTKEWIQRQDPGRNQTGRPNCFAVLDRKTIMLHPKPDSAYTITYYVKRLPSAIFANNTRPLQIPRFLQPAIDDYVAWKDFKHEDTAGKQSMRANYEATLADLWLRHGSGNEPTNIINGGIIEWF